MEKIKDCNNTSVGIIVKKDGKILLIERKKFPFGFAAPAGHVDDGEDYETAAGRELLEEVGVSASKLILLTEGRKNNPCRRPKGSWHYWKIYEARYDNIAVKIKKDEVKNANWYTIDEVKVLGQKTEKYLKKEISDEVWQESPGIEPVWYDWFKAIDIIKE